MEKSLNDAVKTVFKKLGLPVEKPEDIIGKRFKFEASVRGMLPTKSQACGVVSGFALVDPYQDFHLFVGELRLFGFRILGLYTRIEDTPWHVVISKFDHIGKFEAKDLEFHPNDSAYVAGQLFVEDADGQFVLIN